MVASEVSAVLQRVGDLVIQEAQFLGDVPRLLSSLKSELKQIHYFLNAVDVKCMEGNEMMKNLACEIRDVAYQMEEVIDNAHFICGHRKSVISKYSHFIGDSFSLHKLGKNIEQIRSRISDIFEQFNRYGIVNSNATTEPQSIFLDDDTLHAQRSVSPDLDEKSDVIGFDYEIAQIKNDLLDQKNKDLTVISIVGLAGAGKSTLAKVVYSSVVREGYFHKHGWISISPKYIVLDLLREIVRQIMGTGNESEKMALHLNFHGEEVVTKILRKFLEGVRYLIVLDDMWTTNTWDQIKLAFPDTGKGSRIILTTRIMEVGKHPKTKLRIHRPDLLDEEKSWELFSRKAFPPDAQVNRRDLNEFEIEGRKLAKKCNGLPLALVVLGGFLSQRPNIHTWEQMDTGIDWESMKNEGDVGGILSLSYHTMSNDLKSCFLYTASFPEDYLISVHVLKKMWIAEGFVPNVRRYTPEEIAYKYVEELAQRCMIRIEERSRNFGWIKRIKMHDVLREWGVGQARKEGFLKACSSCADVNTTYADELRSYRVALHNHFDNKVGESLPNLRTLLAFNPESKGLFSFDGLNLLRVLHFRSSCNKCSFPKEINSLVHLRYLGLEGDGVFVFPSSMRGLMNLHTLEASAVTIESLPSSLWRIKALKHVHVCRVLRWKALEVRSQSSLQTLYIFSIMCRDSDTLTLKSTIKSLEKMSQHVSWCLGVVSSKLAEKEDPKGDQDYTLEVRVDHLESKVDGLELFGCYKKLHVLNDVLPHFKLFPGFLLELNISCANLLNEDPMPILERLPRLEVLEIRKLSYTGKTITCSSQGFLALRSLLLEDLDVEEWNLQQGSMAFLARLTLNNCTKLKNLGQVLDWLDDLVELRLFAMPQVSKDDHDAAKGRGCNVMILSDGTDLQ